MPQPKNYKHSSEVIEKLKNRPKECYKKPEATPIDTDEICAYGCGHVAKFRFKNGNVCCSKHQNSCQGKRAKFSALDHSDRTAKSLKTRIEKGITKTAQIKANKTRKENGHNERFAEATRQRWANNPWQNNLQCPLVKFRNSHLLYQGTYELKFLEKLESEHGLDWVITNVSRGPSIWYDDPEGKHRLYISDFIIGDTIYEIKSGWTWNKQGKDVLLEELNKAKLTRCVELNYNVVLVIDGEEIKWN